MWLFFGLWWSFLYESTNSLIYDSYKIKQNLSILEVIYFNNLLKSCVHTFVSKNMMYQVSRNTTTRVAQMLKNLKVSFLSLSQAQIMDLSSQLQQIFPKHFKFRNTSLVLKVFVIIWKHLEKRIKNVNL